MTLGCSSKAKLANVLRRVIAGAEEETQFFPEEAEA
ncbi:hypothetical protein J2S74_002415 [Evansella vedderi]|uniref:Uncharacterized protein n=1 Tax=Evansella vedderi TaxID=38282 RepID=A0ABT9ZUW7_9BACI|nr:hypothetical protein [Evansella vedderi]